MVPAPSGLRLHIPLPPMKPPQQPIVRQHNKATRESQVPGSAPDQGRRRSASQAHLGESWAVGKQLRRRTSSYSTAVHSRREVDRHDACVRG